MTRRELKPWQHSATDGHGARTVTLDGKEVTRVVFADTKRGYILKHTGRITRSKELQLVKLRGKVEVKFAIDTEEKPV